MKTAHTTLLRWIAIILVSICALVGIFFISAHLLIRYGFTNTAGIIDTQSETYTEHTPEIWQTTEQWATIQEAITKDIPTLLRAGKDTGIEPRMIASLIMVEQMRLFFDNRELFEQVFAPLKILGNQSQFSWGVLGLKQDTAKEIESNLQDTSSPFYIGPDYVHMLDFETDDIPAERFARITKEHDRYYAYLYAGLYIRQILHQWEKAGYLIDTQPGIIATLYNIGFSHSVPKANPQNGGSTLTIDGTEYSFGRLAESFYFSDELTELLPRRLPITTSK